MATTYTPEERMIGLAQAGIVTSIAVGPCGEEPLVWTLQMAGPDGVCFARPFRALGMDHCLDIAQIEAVARGWISEEAV